MPHYENAHHSSRIRVLIVDDIADDAHTMRAWLTPARDIQVVGVATNARDGIKAAHKYQPDVILMAVHLQGVDGLEATQTLDADMPARVILMSHEDSREARDRAMWAGARAYLPKPPHTEDLLHAIRNVAQSPGGWSKPAHRLPSPAGSPPAQCGQHIIAVCGPKGGVGRSVIATNLAVALAETGGKTVLIDANLESGVDHILLGIETTNSLATLLAKDELDAQSIDRTAVTHASGLRLLRAPCRLSDADRFHQDEMRAILVEVREHFDFVVVDLDNRFSVATIVTLRDAERILLVTTLEITSIDRVNEFLSTMHEEKITSQPCLLVGNRYDGGYRITPRQVEQSFKRKFVALLPDDVRTVVASVNEGRPFVTQQRRAPIARAIRDLATRLRKELPAPTVVAEQARSR